MANPTWAILSDLSGVEKTPDGFGAYTTKDAALRSLVDRLTTERLVISSKLRRAQVQLRKRNEPQTRKEPAATGKFATRAELEAAIMAWRKEGVPSHIIAKRAGVSRNVAYPIIRKHERRTET